jgi:hypothetical protein
MTLEQMREEQARLWSKFKEAEKAEKEAAAAWFTIREQVRSIIDKEKLRAELLAEMQSEICVGITNERVQTITNPNAGVTQPFSYGRWTAPKGDA